MNQICYILMIILDAIAQYRAVTVALFCMQQTGENS